MVQKFVIVLSLITTVAFSADVINVRGVVQNSVKKPIANAILTLSVKGLKDTTTSDGKYLIADPTSTATPEVVPHTQKIRFNNGILELDLPASSPVKVELFDIKGHLVKKEIIKNAQAGMYRLNIGETGFASNLLVIHASIGQSVSTFRYCPLSNGNAMMQTSRSNTSKSSGSLAKVMVINDTVKVSAAGYTTKAVAITSYDTLLDITLDSTGNESVIAVNLDQEKQTIAGFGINGTIMSGKTLPWDQLFTLEGNNALGLSILRIGMNENGDHREVASGWEKAKELGAKVIGSCWSAKAGWKTNNNVNNGGFLKPEYYDDWATLIADYAKKNGLYAMGVANEADFASGDGAPRTGPYPSMVYTGKMMADFVKVAGPIFKQRAPGVKLIAPEASLWIHVWSNISANEAVEKA